MENVNPLLPNERLDDENPTLIEQDYFKDENANDISAPSPETVVTREVEAMAPTGEQSTNQSAGTEGTPSSEKEPKPLEELNPIQRFDERVKSGQAVETSSFRKPDGSIDYEKINRYGAEQDVDVLAGVTDTTVELINMLLPNPMKLPKPTRFESESAQIVRDISGVMIPEMVGVGLLGRLAKASHARVGWKIGNQPWMRFLGNRGIEAGTTALIANAKSLTSEPGNAADLAYMLAPAPLKPLIQKSNLMSGEYSGRTLNPDEVKSRNMTMDVGLGFLTPLLMHAGKMRRGATGIGTGVTVPNPKARAKANLDAEIEMIGNTPTSSAWIENAKPKDRDWRLSKDMFDSAAEELDLRIRWDDLSPEDQTRNIGIFREDGKLPLETNDDIAEALVDYGLEQSAALDELGRYNLSIADDVNVPLKGVNDLYDFNEVGMRTVDDFGVMGAAVDQARIANNMDTVYGRLRNMISPAALKYAVRNLDSVDDISLGLARDLDQLDNVTVKGKDWSLTNDDLIAAGEDLTLEFIDPALDVNGLRRMFNKQITKTADGTEVFRAGYGDIFRQMVKMGKEFQGMTVARAQAYVGTSLAGQISDIAEAARFSRDNEVVIKAAQEKIMDNMKFLMRLKGSTNYFKNMKSNAENLFNTKPIPKRAQQLEAELVANYPSAMKTLDAEIDKFANDMQWAFDNYPELGDAIMELYEVTDGRVFDIMTVNSSLQKSFGQNPLNMLKTMDSEMPNLIGQATRANMYNSMFSPVAAPAKALVGNIGGIIDEPVSYFAGAFLRQDWKGIKDGFYAYRAIGDIKRKAMPMMGQLYEKAAQNSPDIVQSTDLEYILRTDRKLNAFRELAAAERTKGNIGIGIMVDEYIMLQDMANDPVMKFASNGMTGLDGMPQALIANAEAKFRAIDEMDRMIELGEEVNGDLLKATATREYDSMFNKDGLIKDNAAKYQSDRIALRVDSPLYQKFNNYIKEFPFMRLFNPVPGMMANVVNVMDESIPAPLIGYQKDINQLAYTSMEKFAEDPNLVRNILERKGFNVDSMDEIAQLSAINRLKNKTLGRRAVSTFIMGSMSYAYMNGRVIGDGLYDQSANQARQKVMNYQGKAAIKVGDNWVDMRSLLGPGYGGIAASYITALENVNYIGVGAVEDIQKKFMFTLAATLEDPSGFGGLRPIFDAFQGNTKSAERWAAAQINMRFPAAAVRNEIGNILNGGQRLIDADIAQQIQNRNKALGPVMPEGDLPRYTNPLTGEVPNTYNPFVRLFNQYSPFKITENPTPNGLFLNDIGYSYASMFKSKDGVKLNNTERARLFEIVGKDQVFNKEITRIRKRAERQNFVERLRIARNAGADSEELSEFMGYEEEIRAAASLAENLAWEQLEFEFKAPIFERKEQQERGKQAAQYGVVEFMEQLPVK
jgi:hypothetical protein